MNNPVTPAQNRMAKKARKPITHVPKQPRGKVIILQERCKGCEFCVEFCPRDVLELSPKFNAKGYHFPYVTAPEMCVNCQLCYYLCPEFAIYVIESMNNGNPPKGVLSRRDSFERTSLRDKHHQNSPVVVEVKER